MGADFVGISLAFSIGAELRLAAGALLLLERDDETSSRRCRRRSSAGGGSWKPGLLASSDQLRWVSMSTGREKIGEQPARSCPETSVTVAPGVPHVELREAARHLERLCAEVLGLVGVDVHEARLVGVALAALQLDLVIARLEIFHFLRELADFFAVDEQLHAVLPAFDP